MPTGIGSSKHYDSKAQISKRHLRIALFFDTKCHKSGSGAASSNSSRATNSCNLHTCTQNNTQNVIPRAQWKCRESYFWVLFCVHVCKWQELVPREELPEAAPDPDLWHSVSKNNAILMCPLLIWAFAITVFCCYFPYTCASGRNWSLGRNS